MTTWNYSPVELEELFSFIKFSAFTDSICFSAPSTQVPSFPPLTSLSLLLLFLLAEWLLHHQPVAAHVMDSLVLASLRLVKWSTLQLPTLKRPGLWKKKKSDFPQTAIAKLRIPATSTGGKLHRALVFGHLRMHGCDDSSSRKFLLTTQVYIQSYWPNCPVV